MPAQASLRQGGTAPPRAVARRLRLQQCTHTRLPARAPARTHAYTTHTPARTHACPHTRLQAGRFAHTYACACAYAHMCAWAERVNASVRTLGGRSSIREPGNARVSRCICHVVRLRESGCGMPRSTSDACAVAPRRPAVVIGADPLILMVKTYLCGDGERNGMWTAVPELAIPIDVLLQKRL